MTTTTIQAIDPAAFGHDGVCDHDAGCCAPASHIVASATAPALWGPAAPNASIAFVCTDHRLTEPVASREDAERTAEAATEGCNPEVDRAWQMLLMTYPSPVPLDAFTMRPTSVKASDLSCQGLADVDPDTFHGAPVEGYAEEMAKRGPDHVYGCEPIGHGLPDVTQDAKACSECGVPRHHHQDDEHGSVWLCLNPTCIRDK